MLKLEKTRLLQLKQVAGRLKNWENGMIGSSWNFGHLTIGIMPMYEQSGVEKKYKRQ
jgi:hypothetical protein